jgi:hypothetical protein
MKMHQIKIESCIICEAKDAEIRYMTAHIAKLTKMLELKQEYIAALNYQCNLEGKQNDGRTTERT